MGQAEKGDGLEARDGKSKAKKFSALGTGHILSSSSQDELSSTFPLPTRATFILPLYNILV